MFHVPGERTFTLPDFHDDFHGSALAHASIAVLQALDRTIGGGWRVEGVWEAEEGVTGKVREEVWKSRAGERQRREEDDILVNEHVHNTENLSIFTTSTD